MFQGRLDAVHMVAIKQLHAGTVKEAHLKAFVNEVWPWDSTNGSWPQASCPNQIASCGMCGCKCHSTENFAVFSNK